MASKQSEANRNHWERTARAVGSGQPASQEGGEIRWDALTAEPHGVDYAEVDAGGIPAMWIAPEDCTIDRVILYAHGGGFVSGSIHSHRKMVGNLAKAVGCRALIFDYPYAFQQKHPAQLNAAVAAYRWLLSQGTRSGHIAFAGDSCGAVLALGTLQRARDETLPLPAAIMIISGWFDMALTAPSYETNREKDPLFSKAMVEGLVAIFLGDGDRRDPHASPLYADLKSFPPIFLQVGADETLVDESRMFAERARKAGVEVRLDIFPEMLHSFQMMAGRAPEADDAILRFAEWVRPKLGLSAGRREVA